MPDVHVLYLDEHQLAAAYPLVRSTAHVPLAEWQAFARGALAEGGGVLAAQVDDDCIYGVSTFAPRAGLQHGRVLHVELLVVIELGGSTSVLEALCRASAKAARKLECQSVAFTGPSVPRALTTTAPPIPLASWDRVTETTIVLSLAGAHDEARVAQS